MKEILAEIQPLLVAAIQALLAVGIAQLTLYLRRRWQIAETDRIHRILTSISVDAVTYVDQWTKQRIKQSEAPTSASKLETALLYARRQAASAGLKAPDKEQLVDMIETALGYRAEEIHP